MATQSSDRAASADPGSIEWRWDEAAASGSHEVHEAAGGRRFVFGPTGAPDGHGAGAAKSGELAIAAWRGDARPAWVFPIPAGTADAAALAKRAGRLYAALYRTSVSGCRVLALDADTGRRIWEVALQGVGPIHHSKYRNRVQLTFIQDRLVAFGDESAGRYVEVLDPGDGRLLSSRVEKVVAAPPDRR